MSQWIIIDYDCASCGKQEELVNRKDRYKAMTCNSCGEQSQPVTTYAVNCKVKLGEVVRGGNSCNERPPNCLDTRPLAEGVPYDTWAKNESARLAKVLDD